MNLIKAAANSRPNSTIDLIDSAPYPSSYTDELILILRANLVYLSLYWFFMQNIQCKINFKNHETYLEAGKHDP